MLLNKALGINRGDVVSFTGAGGKTTAMHRLAHELTVAGWRVVTTTTTMISAEERTEHTILEPHGSRLLQKARAALSAHQHITVVAGLTADEEKLIGVEPWLVGELAALPLVDAVIVEADGAKGRSLKAPAAHEPVIPASTSVVVPLAAVDALGQTLDAPTAHRPQLVARLIDGRLGQLIVPETIATVLSHPEGGLKNAPSQARVLPLLNKVATSQIRPAREIAQRVLRSSRVQRVLLSAVTEEDPVREVWGRVAAVVLAAGESRRFGSPKQFLPWGQKTLLQHVVDTVLASSVDTVVVVLGHEAERVGALLEDRAVTPLVNNEWRTGLSSSVKTGLCSLRPNDEACLFVLADQPNVSTHLIDAMLQTFRTTLASLVVPSHRGRRGNPVLFSRLLFPELLALDGDRGGREIIRRHQDDLEKVEVDTAATFLDIDTAADYQQSR